MLRSQSSSMPMARNFKSIFREHLIAFSAAITRKIERRKPHEKHKAIAFEVFFPRLLTRKSADSVRIISLSKTIAAIMHKEIAY